MWAVARTYLGMSRREFLSCSPREFDVLCKRLEVRDRKEQFNAALICSVIANVKRDPKLRPKPFSPQDFMPQEEEVQTDEQQVKMLTVLFGCGRGMKASKEERKPFLRPKVKHG